jgi:hypothetical protein
MGCFFAATKTNIKDASRARELFCWARVFHFRHSQGSLLIMANFKLAIGALAIAALIGSPIAAQAKSHKHMKHHSSMSSSQTTTGANMKSNKGSASNPNAGPGMSKSSDK